MSSVVQLINQASTYAGNALREASSAIEETRTQIGRITWDMVEAPQASDPPYPSLNPVDTTLPEAGGELDTALEPVPELADELLPIGDLDVGAAPEFNIPAPGISLPSQPAQLGAFTELAPTVLTDVQFPEPPPQLDAPIADMPALRDHQAPQRPSVSVPDFTMAAPVPHAVAPEDLRDELDLAYRQAAPQMTQALEQQLDDMLVRYNPRYHTQMAAIEDKLERLMQGGSALAPAVEDAIYERARDKAHAEYRRVQDGAWRDAASRGFTLPPGTLHASLLTARIALADSNARAAQDIAIKQAEMEQQNLQFAITTSAGLRTAMLNAALGYHQALVSINGQALEHSRAIVDMVVQAYNLQVQDFTLRLEMYKAEAGVYEVRLKGAMAAIDLYRAEVEAMRALTQVDAAKVDAYKAQIETLGVLAGVYRSRIDAVLGKAGLEKLKLELFQTQVQTYSAQVQAKSAEWQGYQAAISGEEAKVRVFSQQVQAYGAQVDGYKAKVQAKAEEVRAKSAANQAALEKLNLQLKAYSTGIEARVSFAKIISTDMQMRLSAFQSKVDADIKMNQLRVERYRLQHDSFYKKADYVLRSGIARSDNALNHQKVLVQMSENASNTYTGVAKAALSGMTSIVGLVEDTTEP